MSFKEFKVHKNKWPKGKDNPKNIKEIGEKTVYTAVKPFQIQGNHVMPLVLNGRGHSVLTSKYYKGKDFVDYEPTSPVTKRMLKEGIIKK